MIARDAKIDAFGVGTKVGVSAEAPYLDIVYKLVRFNRRNVRKLSTGKITLAGEKQIFRRVYSDGTMKADIIGLRDDAVAEAKPLLEKVMECGRCIGSHPALRDIQSRFNTNFSRLPEAFKSISNHKDFPVTLSERLERVQQNTGNAQ